MHQTIAEIRRIRLGLLRERHKTWTALNDLLGYNKRDSTLSQIWNRAPDSKTGRQREMGADLARKIEERLSLPSGWMDTPGRGGGPFTVREAEPTFYQVAENGSSWPFSTSRERFDRLPPEARDMIDAYIKGVAALVLGQKKERGILLRSGPLGDLLIKH